MFEGPSHFEKRLDLLAGLEIVQPPLLLVLLLALLAAAVAVALGLDVAGGRVGRFVALLRLGGDCRLGHAGDGVKHLKHKSKILPGGEDMVKRTYGGHGIRRGTCHISSR